MTEVSAVLLDLAARDDPATTIDDESPRDVRSGPAVRALSSVSLKYRGGFCDPR
jgi:hypothetical protein